jgi:hypothetical protein
LDGLACWGSEANASLKRAGYVVGGSFNHLCNNYHLSFPNAVVGNAKKSQRALKGRKYGRLLIHDAFIVLKVFNDCK